MNLLQEIVNMEHNKMCSPLSIKWRVSECRRMCRVIKCFSIQSKHEAWALLSAGRYLIIDFLSPECQQSSRWDYNWTNYRSECWELSQLTFSLLSLVFVSAPDPSLSLLGPITWIHPGFKHSLQLNLQLTEMLYNIFPIKIQSKPKLTLKLIYLHK